LAARLLTLLVPTHRTLPPLISLSGPSPIPEQLAGDPAESPFRPVAREMRIVAELFPRFRRDLVKPVNQAYVGARNQVAVRVDCNLDRAVPDLFFDVDNQGDVLEE
jgi:hypothetical protein